MEELENLVVYLKQTTLETIKTKVIATLFKSHSFFTSRKNTIVELRAKTLAHTGQESPPFVLTPGYQW